MKVWGIFAAVLSALLILAVAAACADEAGALGKLKAAGAAAGAEAAAKAMGEAGAVIEADAAEQGDYVKAISDNLAQRFDGVAAQFRNQDGEAAASLEIARWRVKDFYRATMPAARGEWAAVSGYLTGMAEGADEKTAEMLLWAADGASKGGESAMRYAKFGIAVGLIGKATSLAAEEKYKAATPWISEAADYVKLEAGFADDETAYQMSEAAAVIRGLVPDMMLNIPTEAKHVIEVAEPLRAAMFPEAAKTSG